MTTRRFLYSVESARHTRRPRQRQWWCRGALVEDTHCNAKDEGDAILVQPTLALVFLLHERQALHGLFVRREGQQKPFQTSRECICTVFPFELAHERFYALWSLGVDESLRRGCFRRLLSPVRHNCTPAEYHPGTYPPKHSGC